MADREKKIAAFAMRTIKARDTEISTLKEAIRELGNTTDTCVYDILGEVCNGCRCERSGKQENQNG